VRNALRYVLCNHLKHSNIGGVDPCSSGPWFDGWAHEHVVSLVPSPVVKARTWKLRVGWRRYGLISAWA
jgi:hypothetical protein